MPRDNIYGTTNWFIDEASFIDVVDTGSWRISSTQNVPNELSSMFAEKRAKKNGHKSTDKLLLDLKASDEQNSGLRRELNLKTKENTEMKERIKYLEEAILELEGK